MPLSPDGMIINTSSAPDADATYCQSPGSNQPAPRVYNAPTTAPVTLPSPPITAVANTWMLEPAS